MTLQKPLTEAETQLKKSLILKIVDLPKLACQQINLEKRGLSNM